MRENLENYVKLLFAGATNAQDIQQEILQNTLDRYDDLVAQGKSPQAAYSLAIAGIGDITEILGDSQSEPPVSPAPTVEPAGKASRETPLWKKLVRAISVFLYIIAIIPLIVLSEFGMDIIGLCGTIGIVAVATVLIVVASGGNKEDKEETPEDPTRKAVKKAISALGIATYFLVSFTTGAWHITWLIFLMDAAVEGIAMAVMDLKEGK